MAVQILGVMMDAKKDKCCDGSGLAVNENCCGFPMTAHAQRPSEPPTVDDLMRFVESYSAYTKNAERHGNEYGDIDGANNCWLKIYAIGKELRAHAEFLQAEVERLRLFVAEVAESVVKPEYADGMNRLGIAEDCKAVAGNEMSLHYLEVKCQMERAIEAEHKLAEASLKCRQAAQLNSHPMWVDACETLAKHFDEATK